MIRSRLRKYQDKILKERIVIAILGILVLIIFFLIFGFKLLIGFSVFLDKLRSSKQSPTTNEDSIILPPVLDELPEATNSAEVQITGRGLSDSEIILYVNDSEYTKLTTDNQGEFRKPVSLDEGENTISAKQVENQKLSDLSNILKIIITKKEPFLEIYSPEDGLELFAENNSVNITGMTDEGSRVSVNDYIVITAPDGSFEVNKELSEGENIFRITATDMAGNTKTLERTVKYEK